MTLKEKVGVRLFPKGKQVNPGARSGPEMQTRVPGVGGDGSSGPGTGVGEPAATSRADRCEVSSEGLRSRHAVRTAGLLCPCSNEMIGVLQLFPVNSWQNHRGR